MRMQMASKMGAVGSRALQLVLRAHQRGLQEAAGAAALSLASTLTAAPDWLQLDGAVQALADSAAVLLGAEGGASRLEALAKACAKAAPSACIKLVKAVADPGVQLLLAEAVAEGLQQQGSSAAAAAPSLLQLALAVPDHEALQRQLVETAASAISSGSASLKQHGSIITVIGAVKGLEGAPGLQQLLAEALGAALVAQGAAAGESGSRTMDLVLAVPHLPELQQRLVQALAEGLRAGGSRSYDLSSVLRLLPRLKPWPHLQQLLAPAVADHALLSINTDFFKSYYSSAVVVSDFLLGSSELAASHYSRFAEVCLAVPEARSHEALKPLLASEAVQRALHLPGVQALVAAQVANLELLSAELEFSWRMPQATFPHDSEVLWCMGACSPAGSTVPLMPACQQGMHASRCSRCQVGSVIRRRPMPAFNLPLLPHLSPPAVLQIEAFLLGPQESATFFHFDDAAQAEETAARVEARQHKGKAYSVASAQAGGEGKAAFVEVVKSRGWFEQEVARRAELRRELEGVRALVRDA
jgi:hypothetical protein